MSEAESELQGKEPPAQPVERLLSAFGGVQGLARALDLPAATVEEWRARGSIPRERLAAIAAAAARDGGAVDHALLTEAMRAAPTIEAEAVRAAPADSPSAKPLREPPRWLGGLPPQLPTLVLGALLMVAGFLLAMGTSALWLGPPTDWTLRVEELEENTPPALATLSASLAQLEQQLAALQQQVDALPPGIDRAQLDSLGQEILTEVDRRLAAAPAVNAAGDPARLAALEASLGQLSQKLDELARQQAELQQALAAAPESTTAAPQPAASTPATPVDLAALATASVALTERVDLGEPYAAELATVETLAAGKVELAEPLGVLGFNAMEGIATLDELRAELTALAPAILLAARDTADGDALDDLAGDLSLLLGGRPVGEAAGDSVDARVARAELRLEEGDLDAALGELKVLEGAPATAAQPWLARAEARQATLAAAAEVQQLAQRWLAGN
jgi:hypothetical protein